MKTIAIISQKGGAGKTTLALHLAVEAERRGIPVSLLDLDPQTSALGWKDDRKQETPSVISIQASRLPHAVGVAKSAKAKLVIVDSVANSPEVDIAAAEVADLILIPTRARKIDFRAMKTSVRIVKLTGKGAFVVLNAIAPNAPRLLADALEAAKTYTLPIAPVVLHQRAAYGYAMDTGKTAPEYDPHGAAVGEVEALFAWLHKLLRL